MMSSISSWGIAAGVGIAVFLAAMALTGGFKSGGYTGDGGVSEFAGVVHAQEFVFDAPATERLGRESLEAFRSGRGGENDSRPVVQAFFDGRVDAVRWAQSQDSTVWLPGMAQKTRHRWEGYRRSRR